MYLGFGMPVMGTDAVEAGTLEQVLIDPVELEITHVVVRSPRASEAVVLPLNLVQGSAGDRLLLHVASGDLDQMPRYYPGPAGTPPSGRVDPSNVEQPPEQQFSLERALDLPTRTLEFGPDTLVSAADGADGHLIGVAADQYLNHVSELRVVGLRGQQVVIPKAQIGEMRPGTIRVNATDD